ncbi:molybdopterin oxidoreductase [Azorhizobium oxalatiphilum]|uniref:Molybdopterin oxidoreductase n=1 Tax=Azorhizobium oxalatiphilum TaxID=980631 RepID=A0A917BUG9_9HYPH|nr:molybdopterin-dependent oxidoreductase [Azorhizobium oxalatiphilum]GGF57247.1 molybdopterin oxidoreductase [Azorhizobium oxalatiphilum]
MAVVEKQGYCTLCRSRCGTLNVVENGRLVAVRPDPSHPTGKALCPKGRAAPEIAHSARRLKTPLRRTAPKGAADPGFVPISWDEALDEIAGRLSTFARESGPESVAFAVTSGSSSPMSDCVDWIQRFIRGFGSPNTCYSTEICNWHKDVAHAFTFGCGIPTADYRNADLILLWGHNPANSWLAQAEAIGAAQARGAKLVVIDPRNAGSGQAADHWLRIRPGTDGVLALAVSRLLLEGDTHDADFVRHWTNAPLLVREDNGLFLRGADIGGDLPADAYLIWDQAAGRPAAASADVDAALDGKWQVETARGPLACRPAFAHFRAAAAPYDPETASRITGISAEQIETLAELIGNAKSVCYHGWTGLGQHTNATQTDRAIATLYALTGSFDIPGGNVRMAAQPVNVLHSMALMPEAQRARAIGLTERPVGPPADGWIISSDFYDAVLERRPYPIRALVGFGSNLLVSHPAPERGRKALEKLEFQVHCDLFLNPTAAYADIVLPVDSAWEREGLRVGFEVTPEAQELVQLRPVIVPRQGDSRSDIEVVFALATRLGMDDLFFGGDVDAGMNHMLAPLGIDMAALRDAPGGIRLPLVQRYRKYRDTGFATETGKVELYSEKLLRVGQPPVPFYVPPAEQPSEAFPLTVTTANSGYFCHSQHRGITALRRKRPEPMAEFHPDLAHARNIRAGDTIALRTRLGSVRLKASLNAALDPDLVVADYGWWQGAPDLGLPDYVPNSGNAAGSNFNALVDERQRDPVSGSLPLRSFACDVELAEAGPWAGHRRFTITARSEETAEVVALTLVPEDGLPLPGFRAGQSIGVRIEGVTRSYSLTGAARERPDAYSIAVRHIAGGALSPLVTRRLKVGDTVEVTAPSGSFLMPVRNEFPVVLIAAGIGITPFLSYLETLSGEKGEPQVILHYACRDGDSHPFAARVAALAARLPNVTLVTHLSRPRAQDACDHTGRFTADLIPAALLAARARFYMCAGDEMMRSLTAALKARGVPAFEIFSERFASPVMPRMDGAATHEVRFARSGRTILWTPEAGPLLACAEKEGISVPSGCRVGQCESCAVSVISGSVHHFGAVQEGEEDTCLTCQAVPTSDLVLDA